MRARPYTFIVLLSALSMLGFSSLNAALPASAVAGTSGLYTIVSGVPWTDTSGQLIQGHGGGIIKVRATYYWIGQDNRMRNGTTDRVNMACYSSTDLIHWRFINDVLTNRSPGFSKYIARDFTAGSALNRPKVLYNKSTRKYVMYVVVAKGMSPRKPDKFQLTIAISSQPCGRYSYVKAPFQPRGNPSGDVGLYQQNGTGYLLSEDTGNPDHCSACPKCGKPTPHTAACSVAGLYIYRLSSNFLRVVKVIHRFSKDYEAPALFKAHGTYFVLASGKTGWAPNDNQYATARSLTGRWSLWHDFAPRGSDTEISQTMSVLTVSGTKRTTYIYLGDRWNGQDLGDSTYVWQPLTIHGTTLRLSREDSWSINVTTGTSVDDGEPYFYLINRHSGKVLENNGTKIDQRDLNGGTNQQWRIAGFNYAGPGNTVPHYMLVNRASTASSGKDMVLESVSSSPGAKVGLGIWSGGKNTKQEWEISSVNGGPNLQFVNVGGSGLVLSVASASTASGAPINQEKNAMATSQQWRLTEVPGRRS